MTAIPVQGCPQVADLSVDLLHRAQRPPRLPVVLTLEEARDSEQDGRDTTRGCRVVVRCGPSVDGIPTLRVKDLDFTKNEIVVPSTICSAAYFLECSAAFSGGLFALGSTPWQPYHEVRNTWTRFVCCRERWPGTRNLGSPHARRRTMRTVTAGERRDQTYYRAL